MHRAPLRQRRRDSVKASNLPAGRDEAMRDDLELTTLRGHVSDAAEEEHNPIRDSDSDVEAESSSSSLESVESPCTTFLQTFPSTILAGLGMVAAGLVLNVVQRWEVFLQVTELFILMPALLGLKGNLEMTLAARLSTLANLGKMEKYSDVWKLCLANLALVQVQSGVVGILASCIALILSVTSKHELTASSALILVCSACVTSFLTAVFLGSLTCVLVITCHRFHINPDNVAAPLAASLGDVTTLSILAFSANFLYSLSEHGPALLIVIMVATLLPVPGCCLIAWQSPSTNDVMRTGWTPVVLSMTISSAGGFVLDKAVTMFSNMSTFTPLVNGIGGNLVAVHASRLSTFLHKQTESARAADTHSDRKFSRSQSPSLSPVAGLQYGRLSLGTTKVLVVLLPPAHAVFFAVIGSLKVFSTHDHPVPVPFFLFVFVASLLQVLLLLLSSHWLVRFQWRRGRDPDSCTIPYLTALGDLVGTGLLALAFILFRTLAPSHPVTAAPTLPTVTP